MKTFLKIWLFVFLAFVAHAQTSIQFQLHDPQFGVNQCTNDTITLQPWSIGLSGQITLMPVQVTGLSDVTGQYTFTNLFGSPIAGFYHFTISIFNSSQRVQGNFWVQATNLGVLPEGQVDLVNGAPQYPPGTWAWSAQASDARYQQGTNILNLSTMTNIANAIAFIIGANGTNYVNTHTTTNLLAPGTSITFVTNNGVLTISSTALGSGTITNGLATNAPGVLTVGPNIIVSTNYDSLGTASNLVAGITNYVGTTFVLNNTGTATNLDAFTNLNFSKLPALTLDTNYIVVFGSSWGQGIYSFVSSGNYFTNIFLTNFSIVTSGASSLLVTNGSTSAYGRTGGPTGGSWINIYGPAAQPPSATYYCVDHNGIIIQGIFASTNALYVITNQANIAAALAAMNATNVLGTAAWQPTNNFDWTGTAQKATNGLATSTNANLYGTTTFTNGSGLYINGNGISHNSTVTGTFIADAQSYNNAGNTFQFGVSSGGTVFDENLPWGTSITLPFPFLFTGNGAGLTNANGTISGLLSGTLVSSNQAATIAAISAKNATNVLGSGAYAPTNQFLQANTTFNDGSLITNLITAPVAGTTNLVAEQANGSLTAPSSVSPSIVTNQPGFWSAAPSGSGGATQNAYLTNNAGAFPSVTAPNANLTISNLSANALSGTNLTIGVGNINPFTNSSVAIGTANQYVNNNQATSATNSIVIGTSNIMTTTPNEGASLEASWNSILEGLQNTNFGANFSTIVNGQYNTEDSYPFEFTGSGQFNLVHGSYSAIADGQRNAVGNNNLGNYFGFIGSGATNGIDRANIFFQVIGFDSILNGYGNTISQSADSTILGGQFNFLDIASSSSSALGASILSGNSNNLTGAGTVIMGSQVTNSQANDFIANDNSEALTSQTNQAVYLWFQHGYNLNSTNVSTNTVTIGGSAIANSVNANNAGFTVAAVSNQVQIAGNFYQTVTNSVIGFTNGSYGIIGTYIQVSASFWGNTNNTTFNVQSNGTTFLLISNAQTIATSVTAGNSSWTPQTPYAGNTPGSYIGSQIQETGVRHLGQLVADSVRATNFSDSYGSYPPSTNIATLSGIGSGSSTLAVNISGNAATASNATNLIGIAGNALVNSYQTRWMTNSFVDWWSADTIAPTNNMSIITNWIGRAGNVLAGNCFYTVAGINGLPSAYFDGSGNNIMTNGSILGGYPSAPLFTNSGTIIVVFRNPNGAALTVRDTPNQVVFDGMLTNSAWDMYLEASRNQSSIPIWNTPPYFSSLSANNGYDISAIENTKFHWTDDTKVLEMTWQPGQFQVYWNGVIRDNYPAGFWYGGTGFFTPPVGFEGTLALGQLANRFWPMNGWISEFYISTNYFSPEISGQSDSYFMSKYGLNRNTINIFSDSIANGFATNNDAFADCVASNFPNWTVNDVSAPGVTSSQILSNILAYANYGPIGLGGAMNIDIVMPNLNNDYSGITNAYQAALGIVTNNLITAARALSTNGAIPIAVIPFSNLFADTNGMRFAFSNWVYNCSLGAGYRNLLNFGSDPNFGQYTQYVNTAYFPVVGNIHPTNSLYLEANQSYVVPVLNSIIHNVYSLSVTTAPPPTISQPWSAITGGGLFINNNGAWVSDSNLSNILVSLISDNGNGLTFTNSQQTFSFTGNTNNYLEINIQNLNNGTNASSDIVATAATGNANQGYIDMGINSTPFIGYVGSTNDGYLYVQGIPGTNGGNLLIGAAKTNQNITFFGASATSGGPNGFTNELILSPSNATLNVTMTATNGAAFAGNGSGLTSVPISVNGLITNNVNGIWTNTTGKIVSGPVTTIVANLSAKDSFSTAGTNYGYFSVSGTNANSNVGLELNQNGAGGSGNNSVQIGIVGTNADTIYGLITNVAQNSLSDFVIQMYVPATGTFTNILRAPVTATSVSLAPIVPVGPNTAGTIVNTNWIIGGKYSFPFPILVNAKASLAASAVAGSADLDLEITGNTTNTVALQTTALSIAMAYTNMISGFVPANTSFDFTNRSAGAGDSAGVSGGQYIIY